MSQERNPQAYIPLSTTESGPCGQLSEDIILRLTRAEVDRNTLRRDVHEKLWREVTEWVGWCRFAKRAKSRIVECSESDDIVVGGI